MILEYVENVSFEKSPRMNEPDWICSETAEENALDVAIKKRKAEKFWRNFQSSQIIRKELEHQPKWRYNGTFEDFETLIQLATLIRWILVGPYVTFDYQLGVKSVDKMREVISQLVLQSFKTNKEENYAPHTDNNCIMSNTPLSTGLDLYMHKKTRCEEFVNTLYNLNLWASYNKLSKIKYDVAREVEKNWKPVKYAFRPKFPRHILSILLLIFSVVYFVAHQRKQNNPKMHHYTNHDSVLNLQNKTKSITPLLNP